MFASLESNLDYKESLFCQDDCEPISQTDEDSWLQQVLHPNDFSLFQDNAHDTHNHKSAELDLKMEDEFDKKPIEDKDNSSKLNASNLKDLVSKDSQIINFEEQKEIFAEPTYLPLNNLEMNQKIHELEGYSQAEIGESIAKKTPISLDTLKRIATTIKTNDPNILRRFGRTEDRDLFFKLKQLCTQRNRIISDFCIHNKNVEYTLDEILDEVLSQINFKGSKKLLLKRIRKVVQIKEFSVRDRKLLKNLIDAHGDTHEIDFIHLEYSFLIKRIVIMKPNKKLYSFQS